MSTFPPRTLTIAGSDSGGSAGLQADLKTFEARGVFGCSAVTAITAQNTLGIRAVYPLPDDFIRAQIAAVLDDMGADALKTGFLGRVSLIQMVAELIQTYHLSKVVIDPVLVNGQGVLMFPPEVITAYQQHLFPLATAITPNLDEAALLAGIPIDSPEAILPAAQRLYEFGVPYVVIKGGHFSAGETIQNWVYDGEHLHTLTAPRLAVENPHGVGCTFAAAITAELAKGKTPVAAIQIAHDYLQTALAGSLKWQIGQGRSPVFHGVGRLPLFEDEIPSEGLN